ncbi:secreted phosphoprotein 24 [Callorhinchus milii]|uniref:secreted phosphoprotein 24 n=1 Tax=Callorhinchus milii TaxID=7868 RepID=UPI000457256F|nr:secreted phosphoprotein 24 [Callorhinchus milii]|eukprot:gi/632978364/ref/XP_007905871.1/ PREDICTED: secreted phosphoprotein 24-like [Callorhinchus milii]
MRSFLLAIAIVQILQCLGVPSPEAALRTSLMKLNEMTDTPNLCGVTEGQLRDISPTGKFSYNVDLAFSVRETVCSKNSGLEFDNPTCHFRHAQAAEKGVCKSRVKYLAGKVVGVDVECQGLRKVKSNSDSLESNESWIKMYTKSRKAKSRETESREDHSRDIESREAESSEDHSRDIESREAESREDHSRDIESREAESREDHSRDVESREDHSRDVESREAESTELESREDESREAESRASKIRTAIYRAAKSRTVKSPRAKSVESREFDSLESREAESTEVESNETSLEISNDCSRARC